MVLPLTPNQKDPWDLTVDLVGPYQELEVGTDGFATRTPVSLKNLFVRCKSDENRPRPSLRTPPYPSRGYC